MYLRSCATKRGSNVTRKSLEKRSERNEIHRGFGSLPLFTVLELVVIEPRHIVEEREVGFEGRIE